jgi:hypothetical protein
MKWKCFSIAEDDVKAKKHISENLAMGASRHILSQKLLGRFSDAVGPMILIAFDLLDLSGGHLYASATYDGGKGWYDAVGRRIIPQADCPIGGLVDFLTNYLQSSTEAVVVCENWADTRKEYQGNWRPRESQVEFFQEDVYHILTSVETSFDAVEAAIRESMDHWAVIICSVCKSILCSNVLTEACLNTLAMNTDYIIVPALDGEGYLVWAPQLCK